MANTNKPVNIDNLFVFDDQTKETVTAAIIGLLIAQLIVFFGRFLVGTPSLYSIIWTILYAIIGGVISGFLISKLYYPFMDFVSQNLSFLMPLVNTFFKLLFVPIVIGSIIGLFWSLVAGGLIFALGAGLGGVAGGALGGLIGGSLILVALVDAVVMIIARFIFAKFMVSKVGKYYTDYK